MARIARVLVPGACCVGRSLAIRGYKRKVKILKIKYGVPRIPAFSCRREGGQMKAVVRLIPESCTK